LNPNASPIRLRDRPHIRTITRLFDQLDTLETDVISFKCCQNVATGVRRALSGQCLPAFTPFRRQTPRSSTTESPRRFSTGEKAACTLAVFQPMGFDTPRLRNKSEVPTVVMLLFSVLVCTNFRTRLHSSSRPALTAAVWPQADPQIQLVVATIGFSGAMSPR